MHERLQRREEAKQNMQVFDTGALDSQLCRTMKDRASGAELGGRPTAHGDRLPIVYGSQPAQSWWQLQHRVGAQVLHHKPAPQHAQC